MWNNLKIYKENSYGVTIGFLDNNKNRNRHNNQLLENIIKVNVV